MRIGIVTLPLVSNYGGYLQAWAMQEKLRKMGHSPITLDYFYLSKNWMMFFRQWAKTILLRCVGRKRPFMKRAIPVRSELFDNFVKKNMTVIPRNSRLKAEFVDKYALEALVVGSDQVWRPWPQSFFVLEEMFLRFAKKKKVKKIAYAASFGLDKWTFTPSQTRICASLVEQFDAISVREVSGVELCKDYLQVDAVEVLDPTLLHVAEDYRVLCSDVPTECEEILLCYILDSSPENDAFVKIMSKRKGLKVRKFTADDGATISIEQWLAMYRDAKYVVTDSFHGTVFSILFHKPFFSIVNEDRGAARFYSLLSKFGLENRLLTDLKVVDFQDEIDWESVDAKLDDLRTKATLFLEKALG